MCCVMKFIFRHRSIMMAILLGAMGPVAQAQEATVSERERLLLERVERLERRLAEMETRTHRKSTDAPPAETTAKPAEVAKLEPQPAELKPPTSPPNRESSSFLDDTTFNVTLDGYYSYNFNRPIGGINLLRAYYVSSNSFSLNQAAIVIENAPNLEKGKRYGLRLALK